MAHGSISSHQVSETVASKSVNVLRQARTYRSVQIAESYDLWDIGKLRLPALGACPQKFETFVDHRVVLMNYLQVLVEQAG